MFEFGGILKMRVKRLFALIATVMLLLSLPITAMAADTTIDLTQRGSIRITLKDSAEPYDIVKGASFTLYFVGTAFQQDNVLRFQLTEAFAGSSISLNDLRADGLANHLSAYAAQHNLSGLYASANENGCVLFDDLQTGLYLIVQEGRVSGYYATEPFLLSVPMTNADGTGWIYDIQASPKAEAKTDNPGAVTSLTVEKRWSNGNHPAPDSATVTLLCDGRIFDTQILNENNQWCYKWTNLDKDYSWTVAELDIPDGYQVSYASTGKKVTITNTYVPSISDNPDSLTVMKKWDTGNNTHPKSVKIELWNDTTLYDTVILSEENNWTQTWSQLPENTVWHIYEVEIPEQYDVSFTINGSTVTILNKDNTIEPAPTPSQPSQPSTPTGPSLIQTGQLNWPIPVLAIAGILLFISGWVLYFRGRTKHEK